MPFNRRELMKFFGAGAIVAPVVDDGSDIRARLMAPADIELVSQFPNGHTPGHWRDRLKWNPFEALWLKFWQIENNPPSWLNSGVGPLESVLKRYPTPEEKAAVAGVIQWFGTNCGHCFLEEVLLASGYRVTHDSSLPNATELNNVQYGGVWANAPKTGLTIQRRGRAIVLRSGEDPA